MSCADVRDLQTSPLWQAKDLGYPIPDSAHAVSVAMPTWDSVIGYEEGDPAILKALQCGYPRFFLHPLVQALFAEATRRYAGEGEAALVLSSEAACERCRDFLRRELGRQDLKVKCQPWSGASDGAGVIVFPEAHKRLALRYWRYTGEVVSSRQAELLLGGSSPISLNASCSDHLRERLASWSGQSMSLGYLYATGMAAIFAAFRAATEGSASGITLQLEFPYVDVYCIQKHLGIGAKLLLGDALVDDLKQILNVEPIRAVFCEIPCNPLTRTVDLAKVSALCRAANVPLIVDDTLGTVHNVDVYPYADIVTTSLTKSISGCGDVMGGSVWVCRDSPFAERFQRFFKNDLASAPLHPADAAILLANSEDFPERMDRVNDNAAQLADMLEFSPKVAQLFYPSRITAPEYEAIRRPHGGFGSLMSVVLRGGETSARAFYDALRVSKGPSLGTNFTLACPYTLLAHYEELDWAESCGVSRHLIRIAVGMEPIDELIHRVHAALNVA